MKSAHRWYGLLILAGSILWITGGIVLSLREPGDGQGKYRKTHDFIFVLGIGMLLIQLCLAHLLWRFQSKSGKLIVIAGVNILGGLCFVAGAIVVALYPGSFPYLLFSGYLISLVGLILTGIVGRQQKLFSTTVSVTIMVMGACFLFFNDQYMPWMASVLGGVALWLSYLFLFRNYHFSSREVVKKSVMNID